MCRVASRQVVSVHRPSPRAITGSHRLRSCRCRASYPRAVVLALALRLAVAMAWQPGHLSDLVASASYRMPWLPACVLHDGQPWHWQNRLGI
jgi:hypothetical protein